MARDSVKPSPVPVDIQNRLVLTWSSCASSKWPAPAVGVVVCHTLLHAGVPLCWVLSGRQVLSWYQGKRKEDKLPHCIKLPVCLVTSTCTTRRIAKILNALRIPYQCLYRYDGAERGAACCGASRARSWPQCRACTCFCSSPLASG